MQRVTSTGTVSTTSEAAILNRIRKLSRLMDEAFTIPVINKKVGLDAILGLIPGIGDVSGSLFTAYMISLALKLNVPNEIVIRMVYNLIIDMIVGSIPLIGDLFDAAFKANLKNLRLLEDYLAQNHQQI
ncbi:MAG: DUF4112 domain-containing protein [bacterium]|jgi:hypothetical protein